MATAVHMQACMNVGSTRDRGLVLYKPTPRVIAVTIQSLRCYHYVCFIDFSQKGGV